MSGRRRSLGQVAWRLARPLGRLAGPWRNLGGIGVYAGCLIVLGLAFIAVEHAFALGNLGAHRPAAAQCQRGSGAATRTTGSDRHTASGRPLRCPPGRGSARDLDH